MAGVEHGNYLSDCGDSDASFVVKGQRVNTRNIPYTLRLLDMSDEDMDTLIDGQSTGKSAKDQKRAKSTERSCKAPVELQFHTPGPPQKEKDHRATADIGALDAMQQMLTAMLQMQMENDRRREEREECHEEREARDREERCRIQEEDWLGHKEREECEWVIHEEESHVRKEKEARELAEKVMLEERQAELEARRQELDKEAAEKRAAKEAEKREAEATRKWYDRLLKSLHPMRENDDLETYLTGMEHTLQLCQVEEAEWVFYLTVNLSGHYATLMHGLTIDEDNGYETVNGRLLEVAGFTTTDAGSKLLAMDSRDIKGKTGLEVF